MTNRLQKKCIIVSGAVHGLLAVILLIGPAFFSSPPPQETRVLDVIPDRLTDGPSRGGNRNATPPPPAPPPPAPRPPQPRPTTAQPVRSDPQPQRTRPSPDAIEPRKAPKQTIRVNTTLVRKNTSQSTPKAPERDPLQDARQQINQTVRSLRSDLSASTTIEMNFGPGDGEAAANYADVVKSIYERTWRPPQTADSDRTLTKVRVTIARDGKVVSSRIVQPSGDPQADQSVRRLLDDVTFIAPFPEGVKDLERTYTISLQLTARSF